jgi:HAD superfamily hydrolase (TIGR01509 family)
MHGRPATRDDIPMLVAVAGGDRRNGRPAAVVFDNDGLLLDTEDAWTRAETELFARYGRTFTMEHKRDMIGSSHLVAAGKLERTLELPGRGRELMHELHELVMEEGRRDISPRPGAVELVDALRAAGIPIAVASNSRRPFLERVLRTGGLADRFETTVSADDVAHPKPAPDIYVEACRRLGADPAVSVGLEDSPTGAAAARGAGMTVIGIPSLPGLSIPEAHVVAESLADPLVLRACGLVPS